MVLEVVGGKNEITGGSYIASTALERSDDEIDWSAG